MSETSRAVTQGCTPYVIALNHLTLKDVAVVGGKNASLGEMIGQLDKHGVRVPNGFATTAQAYRDFLSYVCEDGQVLSDKIKARLAHVDATDVKALSQAGSEVRSWIMKAQLPERLQNEILSAYHEFSLQLGHPMSVAVRSSATAEDLKEASFAGQQESYLNIVGDNSLLLAVKKVYASLYNDRAISYRQQMGFKHESVALSVGIQKMVRSDLASSGVMFTLDTESGFSNVVFITASYGLGETIVQGAVNPDEYYVHKPMLEKSKTPIIRRSLGTKLVEMVFNESADATESVMTKAVDEEKRSKFTLTDAEVIELAKYAVIIEKHYGMPMDIEWGKDGVDGKLYILQARPETVNANHSGKSIQVFKLKTNGKVLTSGRAIGQKVGVGRVRLIHDPSQMHNVQPGDVLVADMTDPNWEPVMRRSAAIVTNRGGRTCHAAIVAREIGVPAIVGCGNAMQVLKDGQLVTVSCAEGEDGRVYEGAQEMEESSIAYSAMPVLPVRLTMNVGNPQMAFKLQAIPNNGVGLARLEFIINDIGVHPNAVLAYPNVDEDLLIGIESVCRGYSSPRAYYVQKLSEGVATIAAAFWPKQVIVRLSDFKSNEYRTLMGGTRYEPEEENPMMGLRGASRYIATNFAGAFNMECEALKRVRNEMGLTNVEIMVPFVRTLKQARSVLDLLAINGLKRGENGLRIIMMCEVPSNAILADQFLEMFDGFSIGSNDLTQLTLGLDRDSGIDTLMTDFDERDPAVLALISKAIAACNKQGKYIGICGQGPSDHPDFARWLMKQGIDSMSLNPDSVMSTWQTLIETQNTLDPLEIMSE